MLSTRTSLSSWESTVLCWGWCYTLPPKNWRTFQMRTVASGHEVGALSTECPYITGENSKWELWPVAMKERGCILRMPRTWVVSRVRILNSTLLQPFLNDPVPLLPLDLLLKWQWLEVLYKYASTEGEEPSTSQVWFADHWRRRTVYKSSMVWQSMENYISSLLSTVVNENEEASI